MHNRDIVLEGVGIGLLPTTLVDRHHRTRRVRRGRRHGTAVCAAFRARDGRDRSGIVPRRHEGWRSVAFRTPEQQARSNKGNAEFATIMKVIGAMGLHLTLAKPVEDLKAKLKAKAAAKPVAAKKAAMSRA